MDHKSIWPAIIAMTALGWATAWYVVFMGRLVLVALRTGRLQARGVVYDRETQPKRYWFGALTVTALGVFMIFATAMLTPLFLHHLGLW